MAFSTYLGGLKHFTRVWFQFFGAGVLSTSCFLLTTCYSLSVLALAFSCCCGTEGCKQENLENYVSRAGAWFFTFSFLQELELPARMGQVFVAENISVLFDWFFLYKAGWDYYGKT